MIVYVIRRNVLMNSKLKELAKILASYSIDVKKGERVFIATESIETREFVLYLIDEITRLGGVPFVNMVDPRLNSKLLEVASDESIALSKKYAEFKVDNFDSFVQIKYRVNDYQNKNVSKETTTKLGNALKKTQDVKINKRKWVLLNYPSELDSYKAKMTVEEFRDYALDVMTVDYRKLSDLIKP